MKETRRIKLVKRKEKELSEAFWLVMSFINRRQKANEAGIIVTAPEARQALAHMSKYSSLGMAQVRREARLADKNDPALSSKK
jgi:hypothetical protein